MRAVVFGAGGLLGRHLGAELQRRGIEARLHDRAACPIEDAARVRAAAEGATVLFNAAAFTNVDAAERQPAEAFSANALGAENIARAATATGAVVVHVSTDFVFDGALDRPYDEFDPPVPGSLYARSKRAGEILVERAAPRHHVVRVQGLYGQGGKNFSSQLFGLIAGARPGLRLDRERRVQPTWAGVAARSLIAIAETDRFGTWHASCRGEATWDAFARRIAAHLGLAPSWQSVGSSDLALDAQRPPNCLLAHRRLAMCGLPLLPSWEDALDEYLAEQSESRR